MIYLILFICLIGLCCLCCKKKSGKTESPNINLSQIYLKYGDSYLAWRYGGEDLQGNTTFKLVLLPYKSERAIFQLRKGDTEFIKKIYKTHNLPPDYSEMVATSEYNTNKDHYLILEPVDHGYLVKASLFMRNESVESYLHIKGNNALYFDKKSDGLVTIEIEP